MKTTGIKKPKDLTTREYCCVLVAAMFSIGKREEATRILERSINQDGVPPMMFAELFLHLSLLLGFPTMLDGLARLREIAPLAQKRSTEKKEKEGLIGSRGKKVFKRIYGKAANRLLSNLALLHATVPSIILDDAYGGIISRPGLSLREREIVNVVVLLIQKLDRQLYSHIRGAMRIGVLPKTLRNAISLTARITLSNPRTAFEMLSSVTSSSKSLR